jgi:hypothetical protein
MCVGHIQVLLLFAAGQVLEGRGNHYHFVVPRDMAINASRLFVQGQQAQVATGAASELLPFIRPGMNHWTWHSSEIWQAECPSAC